MQLEALDPLIEDDNIIGDIYQDSESIKSKKNVSFSSKRSKFMRKSILSNGSISEKNLKNVAFSMKKLGSKVLNTSKSGIIGSQFKKYYARQSFVPKSIQRVSHFFYHF
jgi:hypothetical protein